MKVRIEVKQNGLYDGKPWPAVGEVIDLPDHVALGMLQTGTVKAVKAAKVETATPKTKVETAVHVHVDPKEVASTIRKYDERKPRKPKDV